jgi:hypothetical protein
MKVCHALIDPGGSVPGSDFGVGVVTMFMAIFASTKMQTGEIL